MRSWLRVLGVVLGLSLGLLFAVPAQAAAIVVSPGTVEPGGTITIKGNVLVPPDNHLPPELANGNGAIALYCSAFPGTTAGMPGSVTATVWGPVAMAPGTFVAQVAIRADAPAGDYVVTGRFDGANIGVSGSFTVAAAVTPQPTAQPTAPATAPATAQPTAPATAQPTAPATTQWPSWWPAALAGLAVVVLSPWVGIVLLWRRRRF